MFKMETKTVNTLYLCVCEFIPYNILKVGGSHGGGMGVLK
jgi:hypothetical protein